MLLWTLLALAAAWALLATLGVTYSIAYRLGRGSAKRDEANLRPGAAAAPPLAGIAADTASFGEPPGSVSPRT